MALVDDDEDLRLLLRNALELRGFTVVEFESTEEALGWERPDPQGGDPPIAGVDLILLDVSLPGVSGIETIELLKQTPALRKVPIAMLTARAETEVVLRCIKSGAADYFIKPLDFPEVMRRIDRLLADPSGSIHKSAQSNLTWNFQECLVREIKRAERSEEPLGLVLGAIRKLGQNPDTPAEDEIAHLWSQPMPDNTPSREEFEAYIAALRRNLREYDVVAPFGVAEFAIVLPDTSPAGTVAVIRKLHAIFQNENPPSPLPRSERWGLFVGGATFPEEGRDRLDLFNRAERSLSESIPEKPRMASDKDLVFLKTLRCLSCGRHYSHPKVATRRLTPIHRESDFRTIFEGIDPLYYGAVACPHCGFGALEQDLKAIRRLEPPSFGWQYRKLEGGDDIAHRTVTLVPEDLARHLAPPWEAWIEAAGDDLPLHAVPKRMPPSKEKWMQTLREQRTDPEAVSLDTALAAHLLAREVYTILGASPLRRARLAHRIAWLHRIAEDKGLEKRFLVEALDFYKTAFHFEDLGHSKPSELEILFLLGELSFRVDREADAVAVFENLVRDPRVEERESFKKTIHRRWYEARNEPGQ